MRRYYCYRIRTKDNTIFEELKSIGLKCNYKKMKISREEFEEKYIELSVEENTNEHKRVQEIINSDKIVNYYFSIGRKISKKEFLSAELYCMTYIYPWQCSPLEASDFGTTYMYMGKNRCKHDRIQTSDLFIDMKKASKYKIATVMPEIFINREIKEVLEANKITGIHFGKVRDYKNRDFPEYYQLFIDNILPKMSDKIIYEFEEASRCKICGKGGLYIRSELIYNKKDLDNVCDFNLTNEYLFGPTIQLTVVSKKVMELLKQYKCKVGFDPITII